MARLQFSPAAEPRARMARRFVFHVQLRHTDVWRRISLPVESSFAQLHAAIQDAFGWEDCHLYAFRRGREDLAVHPSFESFDGTPTPNASAVRVAAHLGKVGWGSASPQSLRPAVEQPPAELGKKNAQLYFSTPCRRARSPKRKLDIKRLEGSGSASAH